MSFLFQKKVAVFVDGDFWHGRHHANWLPAMSEFWREKMAGNILRDKRNCRKLRTLGWKTIRIWESDAYDNLSKQVGRIEEKLKNT